jgi:acyl dehydratase
MVTSIDAAFNSLHQNIGTEIGVSGWIMIDQPLIDSFGTITQDRQFIHNDPDRALIEAPFGGTIAHGFLILSLASRFAYDTFPEQPGQTMSMNYGFDKIRFLTPVRCGSQVRGRFVTTGVTRKSHTQLLNRSTLSVEIKNGVKPALIAEWLTLAVFDDPALTAP